MADRYKTRDVSSLEQQYVEYMTGKKVVIVGPAASLDGRGQGALIDSHDVVVRLNRDCPVNPAIYAEMFPGAPLPKPEDKGSRTDVLYHVLLDTALARLSGWDHSREQVDAWKADGVKFLVTRQEPGHPRIARYNHLTRNAMRPITMSRALRREIRDATGTNPNTGVVAIAHLLSLPIASLHVTGFDFYETGYASGTGGMSAEDSLLGAGGRGGWGKSASMKVPHAQEGQMAYLRKLYQKDGRLIFDTVAGMRLGLESAEPSVTALVPIKEQSERVPGKNTREMAGKPLLYWTLAALHQSSRVRRVVVDTDSEAIRDLVLKLHPRTIVLMRPDELRGGHITGNPLTDWEMTQVDGEYFMQTHVTNPLLTPHTIDTAIEAYFAAKKHDSLFAVTEHHFRLFDADGKPVNHEPGNLQRSQDLEPLYEDNSNIYIFSRKSFAANGGRIGKKPQMFPMSKLEAIDIDYEEDFEIATAVMERRLRHA